MQYVALEELLVTVEVSCVHSVVESKIAQNFTRVLSSASTLMPLTIPPAKQNHKSSSSSTK
jgi:hypothetical protein